MGSYTKSARSVIQGVSQQKDKFKIEGQCRQQINTIPSPVEGLVKRPSTNYKLTYDFLDINKTYKWFDFELSGDNYQIILGADNLYIIKNLALQQTIVLDDDTKAYLGDDLTALELSLINNQVYILNKNVEVGVIEETGYDHAISAALWAVGISTNKTYSVTVKVHLLSDDSEVYSDSASILVDDVTDTKTSYVMNSLFTGLDGSTWFDTGRTNEVITCRLKEEHQDTHYLTVITDDDSSNTYLKSYDKEVTDPNNLPRLAYEGMRATVSVTEGNIDDWYLIFESSDTNEASVGETIKISGTDAGEGGEYFQSTYIETDSSSVFAFDPISWSRHSTYTRILSVSSDLYTLTWEIVPNNPALEGQQVNIDDVVSAGVGAQTYIRATRKNVDIIPVKGVWKETAKAGTNNFNTKTLPMIIDYDLETEMWTINQDEWLPRRVGDSDSAPFPTFVGKKIKNLYEYNSRLIATTDDSIELSTVDDYDNWFRNTATQLLTTDPFGLTSGKKKGSLIAPVTLNGELFVWGDEDQYKLTGSPISITSSALTGISGYSSDDIEPVVTGEILHFISKSDRYNVLYGFSPKSSTLNTYTAESLSDQISTLIPGNVKQLLSSYNMNTLMITTEEEARRIYLHNYYFVDEKLQQSAWSLLDFGFDIEHIFVSDNTYSLIVKHDGNYHLLSLDLKDLVRPEYIHLDFLQEVTINNGECLPDVMMEDYLLIDFEDRPGVSLNYELREDGTVYADFLKDKTNYKCYVGKLFSTTYEPSLVVERSEQGNIKYTNIVKLGKLGVSLNTSGSFNVRVFGPGFDTTTQYNSSYIPRDLYEFNAQAEDFSIAVRARNDDDTHVVITTESHLPFTINSIYYVYRTSQRNIII